jgi:acetate CoA/acetoacetate CoA-transferase beta subunit
MDYVANKDIIVKRIARLFTSGQVVNLGIGLPTRVADHIPPEVNIILQSENGLMGLGPRPAQGSEDLDVTDASGAPASILPGGCFFDSAASFAIIRGGHVDYTVLGVLEVDQEGSLANYKVPGKMVPGMGGAMDLTMGAREVIAATLHFQPSGASRMKRRCTLPLTALHQVNLVVTDLGFFAVAGNRFHLLECFAPYTPAMILERTDADIIVKADCPIVTIA